jgi:hypothetical protein
MVADRREDISGEAEGDRKSPKKTAHSIDEWAD